MTKCQYLCSVVDQDDAVVGKIFYAKKGLYVYTVYRDACYVLNEKDLLQRLKATKHTIYLESIPSKNIASLARELQVIVKGLSSLTRKGTA